MVARTVALPPPHTTATWRCAIYHFKNNAYGRVDRMQILTSSGERYTLDRVINTKIEHPAVNPDRLHFIQEIANYPPPIVRGPFAFDAGTTSFKLLLTDDSCVVLARWSAQPELGDLDEHTWHLYNLVTNDPEVGKKH